MQDLQQYREKMIQLTTQLEDLKTEAMRLAMAAHREAQSGTDGIALTKVYICLRNFFDQDKATHKAWVDYHEKWKKSIIPTLYEDIGITNCPVASFGKRIQVATKQRVSILPDQKPGAFVFLREREYGDSIYETIQASRLDNIAKEILTEFGEDMPEEYFRVYNESTTSAVTIKERRDG